MQSSRNQTIKKKSEIETLETKNRTHIENPQQVVDRAGGRRGASGFVELELQFLVRHFSESPQTLQNPIDHELDFRLHASSKKP
ncbi:hypothetical protein Scep_019502 [Stephania cephalantha]|uniref:Uncharacterized protein n=1 Tax=Stephania cephalantha TaxID=152367 RepID=A0AAP0NM71_9MAGN